MNIIFTEPYSFSPKLIKKTHTHMHIRPSGDADHSIFFPLVALQNIYPTLENIIIGKGNNKT